MSSFPDNVLNGSQMSSFPDNVLNVSQMSSFPDNVEHFLVGNHLLRVPLVPIKRHVLNEPGKIVIKTHK